MNKIVAFVVLTFGMHVYAGNTLEKTEELHNEAKSHKNPNLTEQTHPLFYNMVKDLSARAHVAMPRYITVYDAQQIVVPEHGGNLEKVACEMTAWVDLLGDLYLCHEILTDLSYEEVEGIVAVAVAEKAKNKPLQLATVGVGTFGAMVALVYCLNSYYNLRLFDHHHSGDGLVTLFALVTVMPTVLITKIVSNNLQKQIDIEASHITTIQEVIRGIEAICRLEETYSKENIFSRIASMLKLKSIYNTLFYPIREFTPEERVQYLQDLVKK